MSFAHHGWAFRLDGLKSGQRLLLLVLLDYARNGCLCAWPSQKILSQKTGLVERQIRRLLLQLQELGLIQISKAQTKGKYVGNVYRIITGDNTREHDKECVQTIGHFSDELNLNHRTTMSDGHDNSENHRTTMSDGLRKEKKSNTKEKKRIINLNKKKESIKKEKVWVTTLRKVNGLELNDDWVDMQEERFSDKILKDSALTFFTAVEVEKKYKYKQPLTAFINWCKREETKDEKPVSKRFPKGRESVVSKDIDEETRRFAEQQRINRGQKS